MISLHKYKPTGGDWMVFLIFSAFGLFGVWCSFASASTIIFWKVILIIGSLIIIVATGIPLSGSAWIDNGGNVYIFPNKNEYTFEKN